MQAQTKINGVGVGFDFNGSNRMHSKGINTLLEDKAIPSFDDADEFYSSRFLISYKMTIDNPKRDFLSLDLALIQGQDNYYAYSSSWNESGDTNYSKYKNVDIRGSILGLRTMLKFRTPSDRRFFYHFGLGLEGLYSYDVKSSGYQSESVDHWPSGYSVYSSNSLDPGAIGNITSVNLLQQVGMAYRLGASESSFPLNKTYIEANFLLISNFTEINNDWSTYRSYGGSFSIIYEFR